MLLAVCLSGCGSHRHEASLSDRQATQTIFSPNGEPLNGGPLGHPTCRDAMTAWFDRVDTNHDHTIDRAEFLADARRQFAVMDVNRDGEITPDELAAYRAPYDVETSEAAPSEVDDSNQATERTRRGRGGDTTTGSGRSRNLNLSNDAADPVMAADANLKFRVGLDDFLTYEQSQFAQLDVRHDQRLTIAEILPLCPSAKSD